VGFELVGGDVPGTAVDEENGQSVHRGSGKGDCIRLGTGLGGRKFGDHPASCSHPRRR
jgi:hypothetical protein